MQISFAATALLMGLAGGPHCVAMCGAACAGIGRSGSGQNTRSMWLFQAGRLLGYSALGGFAAASMQGLGWMSIHLAALRPVWSLFHVAAALLGLMLLWHARQPVWLEGPARRIWGHARSIINSASGSASASGRAGAVSMMIGLLWALLPCGLLYSALLVAAMSGGVIEGAGVMALFALGSGVSLMAGPWLWLRLRRQGSGAWAVRLAGFALFVTSTWALWMSLVHNTAPWCLTP
jgi:sulfite exporter TauE/SafE